jgi:hypothetical protein
MSKPKFYLAFNMGSFQSELEVVLTEEQYQALSAYTPAGLRVAVSEGGEERRSFRLEIG